MKKGKIKVCMIIVMAIGLLIGSFLLGQYSVKKVNSTEIENAIETKTDIICRSVSSVLNDVELFDKIAGFKSKPEEYSTRITNYCGGDTVVYYTNYGGKIKITTKPVFEWEIKSLIERTINALKFFSA